MDIFNIEKTPEELELNEARRQAEYRLNTLISFASALYVTYKDFWNNKIITPQKQCDILGTRASELFLKHTSGVQFVLTNLPNITDYIPDFMDITVIPQDKEVVINQDGSVTITNK